MKRYHFRLDPVLRMRRIEEERCVAALANAQRSEQRAHQLELARFEHYHGIHLGTGRLSTYEFLRHRAQIERAATGVVIAAAEHRMAVLNVEDKRNAWSQAAARVSSLENLDERKREEHRLDANKAEVTELDELTSARFGRLQ